VELLLAFNTVDRALLLSPVILVPALLNGGEGGDWCLVVKALNNPLASFRAVVRLNNLFSVDPPFPLVTNVKCVDIFTVVFLMVPKNLSMLFANWIRNVVLSRSKF
jgi:hypothetical protein